MCRKYIHLCVETSIQLPLHLDVTVPYPKFHKFHILKYLLCTCI